MVSLQLLLVFIGALAVVYALPGPDMALVLQTSTARGLPHGLATAAGLAIARTAHVTLSACGVAALLRNAPWLYNGVRVAGAFYLAYVAIQIFRSPGFLQQRGSVVAPKLPVYAPEIRSNFRNRFAKAKHHFFGIFRVHVLLAHSVNSRPSRATGGFDPTAFFPRRVVSG